MPKVEIREGQLTIPVSEEVREKLHLHGGDELAAHVIEDSVVYTAATPDARERAWKRIRAITDRVRPTPSQRQKPIAAVEQEIADAVKAVRRARRGSPGA